MKRILTATAIASIIAGGALAQTGYQENKINEYLPNVDVSTLNDEQVAMLMSMANSGDMESEIADSMSQYLNLNDANMAPAGQEVFDETMEPGVDTDPNN